MIGTVAVVYDGGVICWGGLGRAKWLDVLVLPGTLCLSIGQMVILFFACPASLRLY